METKWKPTKDTEQAELRSQLKNPNNRGERNRRAFGTNGKGRAWTTAGGDQYEGEAEAGDEEKNKKKRRRLVKIQN